MIHGEIVGRTAMAERRANWLRRRLMMTMTSSRQTLDILLWTNYSSLNPNLTSKEKFLTSQYASRSDPHDPRRSQAGGDQETSGRCAADDA